MELEDALSWDESATEKFNLEELKHLKLDSAEELIVSLAQSADIVVLRALIELLAHGEYEKLKEVANHEDINDKWENVVVDSFADVFGLISLVKFFD